MMYVLTWVNGSGDRRRMLVADYKLKPSGAVVYERPNGRPGAFPASVWRQVQRPSDDELRAMVRAGSLDRDVVEDAVGREVLDS